MNHIPLIIKREYLSKVRKKSFIIMTILSPFILAAVPLIIGYLTTLNEDTVKSIYILDESDFLSDSFQSNDQTIYTKLVEIDLESAKILANQEQADGLIYIPNNSLEYVADLIKFYSEESPSLSFISSLEYKIENKLSELKLQNEGIDLSLIDASKINVSINQESFEGVKTSKTGSVMKLGFGTFSGLLLFMFIMIYGGMVMRSVIEEKTSRVIEVIISSVKPIQLMMGKIVGTSLVAVTQVIIWAVLVFIFFMALTTFFGVDLSAAQSSQQTLVTEALSSPNIGDEIKTIFTEFSNLPIANLLLAFLLYFIGGYLLYTSLFAAIGAAVDNETDSQQFMLPIMIPLILAIYVGGPSVVDAPHGTVCTVLSYIPFTSPVVMLMRIPFGVPIWQQLLSFSILIVTFLFTVWFAAKIYRIGILMYGKKPSYKDLYKWLKY
mgnify:FL=1